MRTNARIGNGLDAPVAPPRQMDMLEQTRICDALKKVAGVENIGVQEIAYVGPRSWMAMISLPDGSYKRYRCKRGKVIDEATIGN